MNNDKVDWTDECLSLLDYFGNLDKGTNGWYYAVADYFKCSV